MIPPKKKTRRKHDFYPTGSWLVEKLLETVPQIQGDLFEPCSGNNDITLVLMKHPGVRSVLTNDVDPDRLALFHLDARDPDLYQGQRFDWIVTNPPFNVGFDILKLAYEQADKGCAFLMRLTTLEPTFERGPWLAEHPPTYQITLPRYSFTGDGATDSVTCAWFVWEKGNPVQKNVVIPRPVKSK